MKPKTILALEQALTLPYATQRFVHLGWRVIRVEPTPFPGQKTPGDPNRYVGHQVAGPDRCSYFFGPNAGKEAITVNLKEPDGRQLLGRLIRELPVDIFMVNTLPGRYEKLGIDYDTLRGFREDLIWMGISALGPDYPQFPGYDPALQAMMGYMHVTGDPEGMPMLCGVPIADLKAGDEAFSQVLLALADRAETGQGRRIDISMAQAAASWLVTYLPLLELGGSAGQLTRNGNEHREFVPVNAYPTRDGHIYLAVGNDRQWESLTRVDGFGRLARPELATNAGRQTERESIHLAISAITKQHTTADLSERFAAGSLVHAPINSLEDVVAQPFTRKTMPVTTLPDGKQVHLAPPAVDTPYLADAGNHLSMPPAYGEHNDAVFTEIGITEAEISGLRERGIVT
jgi:crotonobetainyl-CoA:carnitine CoA-transferase CaiB-like acyl-CoA transferase